MARRVDDDRSPETFLPLHRDTFQILVSLADRERHGYSILRDIEERTGDVRAITPSTRTLGAAPQRPPALLNKSRTLAPKSSAKIITVWLS